MSLKNTPTSSKIAILGFWKEWQSSMHFLVKLGFENITILDTNTNTDTSALPKWTQSILGDNYLDTLSSFDLIIKSPWISPYHEKILPYKDKLTSQTEIFFQYYTGKVIGITGTKWKSTVSSLVYESLKYAWYKVKLVWNIGMPVMEEIHVLGEETYDYVIFELSSYMLEWFCPELYIGYINNIHECHLDWHTSMNIYSQAKYNILENAHHTITHNSLHWGQQVFPSETWYSFRERVFYKNGREIFEDTHIQLLGEHNRINICGVLAILETIIQEQKTLVDTITSVLKNFSPLPHRLENIGTYNGISFIDDGIAVTPEATIQAIKSLPKVQVLLTGGKDIGMNQSQLEQQILDSSITHLVLFPDTGYTLFQEYTQNQETEKEFEFHIDGYTLKAIKTTSMESGVIFALKYASPWKEVLLSSAAQSYSLWKRFEDKWAQYKTYIEKHASI